MEGVRLLPWVGALKRLDRMYGFDCDKCPIPPAQRPLYRCGWIDPAYWPDDDYWKEYGVKAPGACNVEVSQCPGYLLALPQVWEAARAWGHWEKGQLAMLFAGEPVPGAALFAVEAFNAEHCAAGSWELKEGMPGGH